MITLTREEAQQILDALWGAVSTCFDQYSHEQVMSNPKHFINQTIATLHDRLAQPEPEPLIKMKELLEVQGRDGNWNLDPYMQGMYNGMELMVALAEGRDPVFRKAPENWLSALPQREWQGLTDEEIMSLLPGAVRLPPGWSETVRAIEAKLKEKNT
jgi:hypothetical protein